MQISFNYTRLSSPNVITKEQLDKYGLRGFRLITVTYDDNAKLYHAYFMRHFQMVSEFKRTGDVNGIVEILGKTRHKAIQQYILNTLSDMNTFHSLASLECFDSFGVLLKLYKNWSGIGSYDDFDRPDRAKRLVKVIAEKDGREWISAEFKLSDLMIDQGQIDGHIPLSVKLPSDGYWNIQDIKLCSFILDIALKTVGILQHAIYFDYIRDDFEGSSHNTDEYDIDNDLLDQFGGDRYALANFYGDSSDDVDDDDFDDDDDDDYDDDFDDDDGD